MDGGSTGIQGQFSTQKKEMPHSSSQCGPLGFRIRGQRNQCRKKGRRQSQKSLDGRTLIESIRLGNGTDKELVIQWKCPESGLDGI